jgi:hypothetical protein
MLLQSGGGPYINQHSRARGRILFVRAEHFKLEWQIERRVSSGLC